MCAGDGDGIGSSRYPCQAKEACRRQKNASHGQFSSEQARSPSTANRQQILALHMQTRRDGVVAMIGVDVAFETFCPIRRKAFRELAQRSEAPHVPVPDVVHAAVVGIADTVLEFQVEDLPEQLLDVVWVAPSQW